MKKRQHQRPAQPPRPKRNNKQPQRRRDPAEEKADYARRLRHQCTKALRKEAKTVRNLTCQKLARQIKRQPQRQPQQQPQQTSEDSHHNDNDNNNNKTKPVRRLERLRRLSLDAVVGEAARRLGLPRPEHDASAVTSSSSTTTSTTTPLTTSSDEDHEWTERLLRHKRMQRAIETWSGQVTDYRKWCLRREEREANRRRRKMRADAPRQTTASKEIKRNRSKTHVKRGERDDDDDAARDFSQSLFLTLGGGCDDDEDDDDDVDDDTRHITTTTKNNRPGQRARQAKAMALRARREGRSVERSLNWRTAVAKKTPSETTARSRHRHHDDDGPSSSTAWTPRRDEVEEELHPSWAAARKSQNASISTFQGQKITFDE